jgi:hypothetical protein
MNFRKQLLPLTVLLALADTRAHAADAGNEITVKFSQSADNPVPGGGGAGAEVGVQAAFVDWRHSQPLIDTTQLAYGLSWSGYDFSRSGPIAIPDNLQEISLSLGGTYRASPQWLLIASIRPGIYGDFGGSSSDAFNVPAVFIATFLQSRELAWSFGLRADPFSDNAVLPVIGVKWRFAPRWEFTLGFPRAGFSYEATTALKLSVGATVQGGSFHIAEDPRPIPAGAPLSDTYLDYREIRAGLAADYKFNESLSLTAEAGMITDQKFEYYERDLTLNGDAATFFSLGLSARF